MSIHTEDIYCRKKKHLRGPENPLKNRGSLKKQKKKCEVPKIPFEKNRAVCTNAILTRSHAIECKGISLSFTQSLPHHGDQNVSFSPQPR